MNRSPPVPSDICTCKSHRFYLTTALHISTPKDAVLNMSEYNEEIGTDHGIGMEQILREAEQDNASWKSNDMPDTETLRRMILLADWASREPKRWTAYRMFYYDKVGNSTVIARKLHVAERTARRYLLPVRLGRHLRRRTLNPNRLRPLTRQTRGGGPDMNAL